MKIFASFLFLLFGVICFAQDITNTLGTGGVFSIKDGTTTFLSLRQSDGFIGIGTTIPTAKFTLAGSDALINGLTLGKGTNNISTNSAFGYHSLLSNTTGYHNLALGYNSLSANQTGNFNTAAGVYSLEDNTTGELNTAFGYSSLSNNISGGDNTALGSITLVNNTTGVANTAVGKGSLWSNVGNNGSTAVGYHAMYYADDRTTGRQTYNTAVGYEALLGSTTAANNTGQFNTAIGSLSLRSNTTGYQHTAIGMYALYKNTSGNNNTAVGLAALYENTTGSNNVAYGIYALFKNKEANNNTAIGYNALYSNNAGEYNIACGPTALYNSTTGNYNTAFGSSALYTNTTGTGNTCVGYSTYPTSGTLNNYTGIGSSVGSVASASNSVEIGNIAVTWIGGQVGWSTYSDGRFKENVSENVPGLAFINKLRPVTYNLNIHKQNEMMYKGKENQLEWDSKYDIEKIRMTGFIAQEVEKAAEQVSFNFSGVEKSKDETGIYSLRYSEFVVPLVKAVQEQQTEIKNQESIIAELTKRIEALERK